MNRQVRRILSASCVPTQTVCFLSRLGFLGPCGKFSSEQSILKRRQESLISRRSDPHYFQPISKKMSCCPEGAWGQLGNGGYVPKGEVTKVDDLNMYFVGSSEKCIIWNYDIFGFDGGRTKQLADLLAEEGFMVIMPDFYRGTYQDPTTPGTVEFLIEYTNWSKLVVDWENIVLPFAKAKGATRFGCIGTCWGSYMVLKESAYDDMKVGVSMHPSHTPISGLVGEKEKDLLEAVKCPQLFMPAGGDAVETKPGGLGQQVLGDKLEIIEFNDMLHGWTTRGDMTDAKVNRDVLKALKAAVDFIKKHL